MLADNGIVGEALIALQHDDLKQMGIVSVGHRLTILKSVYEIKMKQDIEFDSDHYVPLSKCKMRTLTLIALTHEQLQMLRLSTLLRRSRTSSN